MKSLCGIANKTLQNDRRLDRNWTVHLVKSINRIQVDDVDIHHLDQIVSKYFNWPIWPYPSQETPPLVKVKLRY